MWGQRGGRRGAVIVSGAAACASLAFAVLLLSATSPRLSTAIAVEKADEVGLFGFGSK